MTRAEIIAALEKAGRQVLRLRSLGWGYFAVSAVFWFYDYSTIHVGIFLVLAAIHFVGATIIEEIAALFRAMEAKDA